MEQSVLTEVFLPLALAFIMLGMGLNLQIADFKRLIVAPKAILVGLAAQLIVLPIVGFAIVKGFGLTGSLAVGLMILAACPGGPTSNLISHLAKADIALSISLTALSSVVTVVTIPIIVNLSIAHFGEAGSVTLPALETIGKIVVVTLIPVALGMGIRSQRPTLAGKADKPVKVASAVFFTLIIVAAILKERAHLLEYLQLVGLSTLSLNLSMMLLSYSIARWASLNEKERFSISIEASIQNGTLGIMIAATLLHNSTMTIPIAIYSLIMFVTASGAIYVAQKRIS